MKHIYVISFLFCFFGVIFSDCDEAFIQYDINFWYSNHTTTPQDPFQIQFTQEKSQFNFTAVIFNAGTAEGDFYWEILSEIPIAINPINGMERIQAMESTLISWIIPQQENIANNNLLLQVEIRNENSCWSTEGKYLDQEIETLLCEEPFLFYYPNFWIEENIIPNNPYNITLTSATNIEGTLSWIQELSGFISITNTKEEVNVKTEITCNNMDQHKIVSVYPSSIISNFDESYQFNSVIEISISDKIYESFPENSIILCTITSNIQSQSTCWENTNALGKMISSTFELHSAPWQEDCSENEVYLLMDKSGWENCQECTSDNIPGNVNPLHIQQNNPYYKENFYYFPMYLEISVHGSSGTFVNISLLSDLDLHFYSIKPVEFYAEENLYQIWIDENAVKEYYIILFSRFDYNFDFTFKIDVSVVNNCFWSIVGKEIQQEINWNLSIPTFSINCNTETEIHEAYLVLSKEIYENDVNSLDYIENPFQLVNTDWKLENTDPIVEYSFNIKGKIINGGEGTGLLNLNLTIPTEFQISNTIINIPEGWKANMILENKQSNISCILSPFDNCTFSFSVISRLYLSPENNSSTKMIENEKDYFDIQLNAQIKHENCWSTMGKNYIENYRILVPSLDHDNLIDFCSSYPEPYLVKDEESWIENENILSWMDNPFHINPFYPLDSTDKTLIYEAKNDWYYEENLDNTITYIMNISTVITNGSSYASIPLDSLFWDIQCSLTNDEYYVSLINNEKCGVIETWWFNISSTSLVNQSNSIPPSGSMIVSFQLFVKTDENSMYCTHNQIGKPKIDCSLYISLSNSCWSSVGKEYTQFFIISHFSNHPFSSSYESSSLHFLSSSNPIHNSLLWLWILIICLLCFLLTCFFVLICCLRYCKRSGGRKYFFKRRRTNDSSDKEILIEMESLDHDEKIYTEDCEEEEQNTEVLCDACGKQKAGVFCVKCSMHFCSSSSLCWNFFHSSLSLQEYHQHAGAIVTK